MKLILLSSVFCLLLGFILGRLAPEEEKSEVLKPVVESRRLKSRPEVARERSADRSGREENFEKLRLQVTALPDDPVSRARWKAWILQLRSEEIYEARGILLARERESQNYEIGQNEGEVGDEMLLLLSRWYELDGEGALAWIRGQKVWTRREALKGEIMTITDGFARDPRRGLELSLDWIKRSMTSDPNHPRVLSSEEFRDLILYQVGHWGADPEAMSEQVDADGGLRIPYVNPGSVAGGGHGVRWGGGGSNGFPVTPGYDRQYSENPAMKAFAEGLVASGRMDLAKALSRDLEGGAKEAFQEVFRSAAEKKGWQEVKREIDAGLVEFSHSQTGAVLDEMILEDRDEALDWYLDLPRDAAVSRAEVIEELINYSDTFQKDLKVDSEDPFSIGKALDHDQAEAFLIDLKKRGEPVGEAFAKLTATALWDNDFERVEQYREHLSREEWAEIEERMINVSIRSNHESFEGESFTFASLKSDGEERVRRFGLMDGVRTRIAKTNAETRVKLQKVIDSLENKTGE